MLHQQAKLATLLLRVSDLTEAADWYETHLGVKVNRGTDGRHPVGSFELAGSIISLWELQPNEPPARGSTSDPYPVVVISEGLDDLRDELAARGVHIEPTLKSSNFALFRFFDLDGNVWEVSQPHP